MAFRAPFIVIEAARANALLAMVTWFQTAATVVFTTSVTRLNALRAVRLVAPTAAAFAATADRRSTTSARITLVVVDEPATVGAADSTPEGQFDVGTLGVVGPQNPSHEQEKIQQPALRASLQDGMSSVAFAEHFVDDVRVRDVLAAFRWVRVRGNDAVVPFARTTAPIKLDLKWPEIDAFEHDRCGRHRHPAGGDVVFELIEFRLERSKVLIQVFQAERRLSANRLNKTMLKGTEFGLE